MFEIPLFPLNTVLFPGMPLALHIFEERYKLMIGRCIEQRRPFGVVLIKQGAEALGPLAEPHMVGCTAQITLVERLEQERLNIGAVGRERFRVLSLDNDGPYLLGRVEDLPLKESEPAGQLRAARRLRPWVERYMEQLSQVEGALTPPQQRPREPRRLAYAAAALLQIPMEEKQMLLEAPDTAAFLEDARALYRREVAFLRSMLERQALLEQDPAQGGSFSLN
jgi:Lon protease-like protein